MRILNLHTLIYKINITILLLIILCFAESFDTVKTELGFNWEKLENINNQTEFEIAIPRSHPISEYGTDLWSYTVIRSADERFLNKIDTIYIEKDKSDNFLFKIGGTFSKLNYHSYQIAQIDKIQPIDMSKSYPFPEFYPDSVKIFLLPGNNIESDDIAILNLIDSLGIDKDDMAIAAKEIGTSNFITSIPYDNDNLVSVINGVITKSWKDDLLSSALETMISRKAVCVEIARLQTAMCRAIGIPARTVSWVDLHTWTEVWINGYGWLQMDKGYFPHYMPATLARLSDYNDNVWFDWNPNDEAFFNLSKVKMDEKPTTIQINNTKLIVARPTRLNLPIINNGESIGLIPIGDDCGLYFSKTDSQLSLNIIKVDTIENPNTRIVLYTKEWTELNILKEVLNINLPKLKFDAEVESIGDLVLLKIKSIELKTSNFSCKKNKAKFMFKKSKDGFRVKYNTDSNNNEIFMRLFNLKGELIKQINRDELENLFYWDGKNIHGNVISSGIYILTIYRNDKFLFSSSVNWIQ